MRRLYPSLAVAMTMMPSLAQAGDYAPLQCGKAQSPAERTICQSYALGQQEARMATLFSAPTSLVAMGQRGSIQDAQRDWLQKRDACGRSVPCLKSAYEARIGELSAVIAEIASKGPF